MATVVKAQPRDLIALVWYQLGYRPRDSLVFVALHGHRKRSGAVVRVDLPPGMRTLRDFTDLVGQLAATVRRTGGTAVVAVVVRDGVLTRPPGRLLQALVRVLPKRGVELVDIIGVDRTSFGSLTCPYPECCPPEGTPLDTVQASEVAANLVMAGRTVADTEQELVADVIPDDPADDPADDPGDDSAEDHSGAAPPIRGPGFLRSSERRRWWDVWTGSFAAGRLPEEEAPGLGRALHDPLFRDAVMVAALGVPRRITDEMVSGPTTPEGSPHLMPGGAADLGRLLSIRPGDVDADRLERARAVLAAVARRSPRGDRADALAVMAWLAWYEGHGSRARLLADRAAEDRPSHSLAGLMTDLLIAETPPLWIRRLPSPGRGDGSRSGGPGRPSGGGADGRRARAPAGAAFRRPVRAPGPGDGSGPRPPSRPQEPP